MIFVLFLTQITLLPCKNAIILFVIPTLVFLLVISTLLLLFIRMNKPIFVMKDILRHDKSFVLYLIPLPFKFNYATLRFVMQVLVCQLVINTLLLYKLKMMKKFVI